MKSETKQSLNRLDRLMSIRQIAVDAGEARVRESERDIGRLEGRLEEEAGTIRLAMEEFSQPGVFSAQGLQRREKFVEAAEIRSRRIRQDIEKATTKLEERKVALREALKEKKIVEKLRERQLQQAEREESAMMQKMSDETSLVRHVRNRVERNC